MEFTDSSSSLRLQSLNADSLIWTKKYINIEKQESQMKSQFQNANGPNWKLKKKQFQKSFQNQILSYIKPDYGSLGQFITDINLNTEFLRQKKKKNDGQQQAEQKRIRQHIHNKNLNKILSNAQSSQQERSVACKLLIERSFQQAFGSSINQFYQDHIQDSEPEKKVNLNINSLSQALDQIVNNSKEQLQQNPNNGILYIKQNLRKNRSFLRDQTLQINQKDNFLKRVFNQKNSYRSLGKYIIPENAPPEYEQLIQKHSSLKQFKSNNHKRQNSYSSTSHNESSTLFKTFVGKTFAVTQNQVVLSNLEEISCETMLFLITKMNLQTINEFSLINTTFASIDILFMVLDLISSYARKLKVFVLDNIGGMILCKNRQKLSHKVKSILQNCSETIEVLKLNKIGLDTKDFCVLCLGIGSTTNLDIVQMKDNCIDKHAKKTYQVITKFFKNLEINIQGNTLQSQVNKSKIKSSRLIGR